MTAKHAYYVLFGRMLCGMLLVLGAFRQAGAGEAAPGFTAKSLSGETFTKESLRGSVVLVQFWTTWCPVCRGDQPAVDSIASEFVGQGLVVLAVDVGEPEATVRKYLQERPRSCAIVLTQDTDLVARYKPHSFPLYIAFDRDGNVAGTQSGGGGDGPLRHLLRRAGLKSGAATESGTANSASGEPVIAGQMIVLAGAQHVRPPKPQAATVFVLSSGERLETHQYMLTAESVAVTVDGLRRSIPMREVDVKATLAANRERGIELKIPASRHEILLGR